jgi:hypothetical protein
MAPTNATRQPAAVRAAANSVVATLALKATATSGVMTKTQTKHTMARAARAAVA